MRKTFALLLIILTLIALLPLGVAAGGPSRRSAEPNLTPPTVSDAKAEFVPDQAQQAAAETTAEAAEQAQPEVVLEAELDVYSFTLGLVPSEGDLPMADMSRYERGLATLPERVDMSSELPPIGNQGSQGSCVGWSTAYYYKTLQEARERGWSVAVNTHQFSPAWIYNQRSTANCGNDNGMSFYNAYSILKNKGAATLAEFPYNSSDSCTQPSQAVSNAAYAYRCESFEALFSGTGRANVAALKQVLADGMAFTIGIPVYSSFYGVTYNNPVVPRHADGETYWGGHAMMVVGYDDEIGGFLTANSWGSYWGRNGYCYLSYDFVENEAWEAWVMYDHIAAPAPNGDVALSKGWNLISLPLVPSDAAVTSVFASVMGQIEQINAWDAGSQQWLRYSPSVPGFANTLTHVDPDQGLWVKARSATTLVVTGSAHSQGATLAAGWNLAAYTGTVAASAEDALNSIDDRCTVVMGYQPSTWSSYYPGTPLSANSLQEIAPGKGYWVHVSQACNWTPS